LDCTAARCGDSVVDESETCDDGANNSATRPDACRADCSLARCGDGIRDAEEACDDGDGNSDENADACRQDCTLARCGDGVVDGDEMCDGTSDCDALCRPKKPAPSADAGGCGCRIAPHAATSHRAAAVLGLLVAGAFVRRSQRRRAASVRPQKPAVAV
jgi:MYXO-CTERM domain-containing protein